MLFWSYELTFQEMSALAGHFGDLESKAAKSIN